MQRLQALHAVIGVPAMKLGLVKPVSDVDLEVEEEPATDNASDSKAAHK